LFLNFGYFLRGQLSRCDFILSKKNKWQGVQPGEYGRWWNTAIYWQLWAPAYLHTELTSSGSTIFPHVYSGLVPSDVLQPPGSTAAQSFGIEGQTPNGQCTHRQKMMANMFSLFDAPCLGFFRRWENGLFTEETAVTFAVATVNPGFLSWYDPRNEVFVVSSFIPVSRTQTHAISSA
jgi:hypothetical protein